MKCFQGIKQPWHFLSVLVLSVLSTPDWIKGTSSLAKEKKACFSRTVQTESNSISYTKSLRLEYFTPLVSLDNKESKL